MFELAPFSRGFGLGFGLIAAIGAQNAYVLTRGILRNHHFVIALVCSLLDSVLILAGVMGMGQLVQTFPALLTVATLFGAVFLFMYGLFSFRRMFQTQLLRAENKRVTLGVAVATVLALSLLNPHVYLDTVILIGSVSIKELPAHRASFTVGACAASFVWFFLLSLGGQWMQRWFQTPMAWRILDGFVGIVMWSLAFMLERDWL